MTATIVASNPTSLIRLVVTPLVVSFVVDNGCLVITLGRIQKKDGAKSGQDFGPAPLSVKSMICGAG